MAAKGLIIDSTICVMYWRSKKEKQSWECIK